MTLILNKHGATKELPYKYFGESPFIGLELEIDTLFQVNKEQFQAEILVVLDKENLIDHYNVEKDGSLVTGLEIIFQPHNIVDLKNFLTNSFSTTLDELKVIPFMQDSTPFAGIHFHVSKTLFGDTLKDQIENIAKLWFFCSKFESSLIKIGRKINLKYSRFPRTPLSKEEALAKVEKELDQNNIKNENKYQAINLNNPDTVEFRFFKTTLDLDTLIFYLDFIYWISLQSTKLSWGNCNNWESWFENAPQNIISYLKKL